MGVREFKGKLKNAKNVREFTGKLKPSRSMVPAEPGQAFQPIEETPEFLQKMFPNLGPRATEELGLVEQFTEPGVRAPRDLTLSIAGTLAGGPLSTVPKMLAGPGMAKAFGRSVVQESPRIAASTIGAFTGGASEFAQDNPNADVLDILSAGGQTGLEFAASDIAGAGLGGVIGRGIEKTFPKLDKITKRAIKFAQREGAPIPVSVAKSGLSRLGKAFKSASDETLLGDFVRVRKAREINQFINVKTQQLSGNVTNPTATAQRGADYITSIFDDADESINAAYRLIEEKVGKETPITIFNLKETAQQALNRWTKAGVNNATVSRVRKLLIQNPDQLPFEDVDQLRKTINKASKNRELNAGANLIMDGIERDFTPIGNQLGIDLPSEIKKAGQLVKELTDLNKIPGLKNFKDIRNPDGWLRSFVSEKHIPALDVIKKRAPELHSELLQARMSQIIKEHTQSTEGRMGEVIDGKKLRDFYDANQKMIRRIFGKQQSQLLDNFTRYLSAVDGELKAADKGGSLLSFTNDAFVRAGEAALAFKNPVLFATGETGAAAISSQLMNPNSALFKIFTSTAPDAINSALRVGTPLAFKTALQFKEDAQ